jgi:death-on-curing protein
VADVLKMDAVLIQRYGGAAGVRDAGAGALEAALFRPRTGYYHDIVAEAAALMESLAAPSIHRRHKRIAFAAGDVFLPINGWRLQRAAPGRISIGPALGAIRVLCRSMTKAE